MISRFRGWRVVLVRDDATGTRSLRLGDPRDTALVLLGVLVFAAAFVGLGFLLSGRQRSARIVDLEEQLASANVQTQQVRQLAARLERAESNYRQLSQIMGGEANPSDRDVTLPSLPATSGARGQVTAADARAQRLPTSWPVARRGFVSRSFEPSASGPLGEHRGVDIALPSGSYVRAAGGGIVRAAGEDSVFGMFVRLAHDEGVESLYAHNSWLFVAEGDSVEQNEVLALSGNTGQSSAPHLHFEIQKDGSAVDPATFITSGK